MSPIETNASKLIKKIEADLTKLYGTVNHNSRDRRAVTRRNAYFKCLIDTNLFDSLTVVSEIVCRAIDKKTRLTHGTVINSRKKAEAFISVNDKLFMPIYNDVRREIERAAKLTFTDAIFETEKQ